MVQEYQSPVRVYKFPFEIVMAVSNGNLDSFEEAFLFMRQIF